MSKRLTTRIVDFFTLPTCLSIAGLICAITCEELLGYQMLATQSETVSSYVVVCSSQLVFAGFFMAIAPRVGSIAKRPFLLAGAAIVSLFGSTIAVAGASLDANAFFLLGFLLLSLGSLTLKIIVLEMLAQNPPWKLPALIFLAVFLQPFCAPLFTLPETALWTLAGVLATAGVALIAGAQKIHLKQASANPETALSFQRPFYPSIPVLTGVGFVCASISFLNPLAFYEYTAQSDFLSLTFFTHFVAALLFGLVVLTNRDSSYTVAFKSLNTVALAGFFLMALLGTESAIPRAVCTTAFSLFEFITFLAIADLASYSSTNHLRLFGGYYAFMRAFSLIGLALNSDDVALAAFDLSFSLFGSFLAIACIAASIWLLTDTNLNRFFWGNTAEKIREALPFASSSEEEQRRQAHLGKTFPDQICTEQTNPGNGSSNGNGNDSDSDNNNSNITHPSNERNSAERKNACAFDAGCANPETLVERNANALAKESGLTPREREVFLLMVQGRSSTFIAEQLFVSNNTVRKHIAHIYEKLDVHSKQELLTLVQQRSIQHS